MKLKARTNHIIILALTVSLPVSGPYLEHRMAGVHTVATQGLNTGTLDLIANGWGHQVGFRGENLQIYTEKGVSRVQWIKAERNTPITWYKRWFDAPPGNEPVVVDLSSMSKGLVLVNGKGISRYWVSNLSPLGTPTQTVQVLQLLNIFQLHINTDKYIVQSNSRCVDDFQISYHIPRAFLKPTKNLMVVLEEAGGNPDGIKFLTVRRDDICTYVSEYHPGVVRSWSRKKGQLRSVAEDVKPEAHLKCPNSKVINVVTFASFGNPSGMCGNYTNGNCHASRTQSLVE